MEDILSAKKKAIRNDQIRWIFVPQYEGLGIKVMFESVKKYPDVFMHLPDEKDIGQLPR